MKEEFASILITNFNKGNFLKDTVISCLNQNYSKKEILVFDDCSTDNSMKLLKKFKRLKVYKNKKKKFKSGPLNQIYGISELFKKSKGKIIFLLDGDDQFKKNKLNILCKKFEKNKDLKFIQDQPYLNYKKKYMQLKKKYHIFSIWPSFYPTSCIAMRKNFFKEFLKYVETKKFPNLEIDARLSMFAFLSNNFNIDKKSLTIYNYDEIGVTSNYSKFSINWWKKRNEAFNYFIFLNKKLNLRFLKSPDYFITKFINLFI